MRQDIFIYTPGRGDYGSDWKCYVRAVTPTNARRITTNLERDGETVRRFESRRMTYETPGAAVRAALDKAEGR